MNCTLCNTQLKQKADDFFFICDVCGGYVKDVKYFLESKDEKERYEAHTNDVEDPGYQNFTLPINEKILQTQRTDQLGLDYGCGKGPVITTQLTKKGYRIVLYDPYFYPSEDYLKHEYDYIFSCEVFEHFYHPKQEIEKLVRLLKPGGRLYIMTPFI